MYGNGERFSFHDLLENNSQSKGNFTSPKKFETKEHNLQKYERVLAIEFFGRGRALFQVFVFVSPA
jgi:hypothetical protein